MFQIPSNQNTIPQIAKPNSLYIKLYENNYNNVYMASSQNKFVLSDLPISINLSKCEKVLYLLCKGKKASYGSFYKDKWFLEFDTSTYFTPFESDFVDMTLGNYGQVETANSKALLFIVSSGIVLIEYEIFNPEKETTKVTVSKL